MTLKELSIEELLTEVNRLQSILLSIPQIQQNIQAINTELEERKETKKDNKKK